MIGVVVVVAVHILVIYGLVSGLARKAIEVLPSPIETKILTEDQPVEEPPPPPPPTFEPPPPPFIPMPEIVISQPPPASSRAITAVTTERPVAPPAVARAPVRTAPVVKSTNCQTPDYPAVSERLGEAGSVVVALLVDVDGKVSDSRVEQSSGYPRLDKAALKGLSRCRFTPGTADGKPEPSWHLMKYVFKPAD